MSMPITALVNPYAGGAAKARTAIAADRRFSVRELAPSGIADVVRAEVEQGTRRVLVCGGDGTISAAVAAAAGSALEIAVFPGGTLNHFARDIGLTIGDPTDALNVAAAGAATPVDLGDVNGHLILNTSSVGDYVDFVRRRESAERWSSYAIASLVAALGVWHHPRVLDVRLRADDGRPTDFRTPLLFVGVGERNFGRGGLGARRRGGASALHVLVVGARARTRMAIMAIEALTHGLDGFVRADEVAAYLATEAVAAMSHPAGTIAVDGELIPARSPLHYTLRRGAVRIVTSLRDP